MIVRIRATHPSAVLESILKDVRFGARVLVRSPGISLAVILTLALGIGINSAIFSVVDAVVLRSLRYHDPASLAVIWDKDAQGTLRGTSAANFLDYRRQARTFAQIAGWIPLSFVLTADARPGQAESIPGAQVTANFFRTLGVQPIFGRSFLPDEDGLENPANAGNTAVISFRLWQDAFGGDRNILGKPIELNQERYAIVGVMPQDFHFRIPRHQVWIPITLDRANRDFHNVITIGRVNGSRAQATSDMAALGRVLADRYPKTNQGWTVQVDDLHEWLVANHSFRTRLLILFSAVCMVLLIACTNVASLVLAKSAARDKEIALRLALGATRTRVARQFLTESILLALAGGAVALAMAAFLIASAPALIPPGLIPAGVTVSLSPLVVGFTLLVSIATGVLFGMAPALAATRPDVQETLQDASRGSTGGRGGQRFRQVMVVAEVAVALILLAGASLMTQSFRRLANIDLGFDPRRVLSARLVLPVARYDVQRAWRLQDQFLTRIGALTGVESAAVATTLPLAWIGMEVPFDLETAAPKDRAQRPGVRYVSISDGFLKTLNIPLIRGRAFTTEDRGPEPKAVIVNQAFAARYFPKQDPVGQRIILNNPVLGKSAFSADTRPEIVGLIPNIRMNDPAAAPEPVLYVPQADNVWTPSSWFIVRTRMDAASLSSAMRREMAELEKNRPVDPATSLEQMVTDQFAQPRFQSLVMGVFAGIALVLATVGIYGINAYVVAQRKREIGVRLALGASPSSVVIDSVRRGMLWTGAGIAAGLIGAVMLGPAIRSVIVGIGPSDALTIGASAAFLVLVAIVACLVPAWRATCIDPATALRQE